MKLSFKTGFSFGLTSAIITTLGLMVGLHSGSQSKLIVISGILTIAVADAFSDALGVHISQESRNQHTPREIWETTIATFFTKLFFALTFIIALFLFPLETAIIVNIIWGFSLLTIFSYLIAKQQKINPLLVIGEHLVIAFIVVFLTHYLGDWFRSHIG